MTPLEKTLINGLGRGLIVESTNVLGIKRVFKYNGLQIDNAFWWVYHNKRSQISDNIKPYLRDLSDLDKEIEHNGEKFIPIGKLHYLYCLTPSGRRSRRPYEVFKDAGFIGTTYPNSPLLGIKIWDDMRRTQFRIVEKLLEWHFNVFDLPESDYIKVTKSNNPYE